ncbi:MAG: hypothetical protein WC030_01465 [Candidatus Paceibacterota bacterium]
MPYRGRRVLGLLLLVSGSFLIPQSAEAVVTLYYQPDASGVMSSASSTNPGPTINSGNLGNLNLLGARVYATFTLRDPNASNINKTPWRFCLQNGDSEGHDCRVVRQHYSFTDADRELLSDGQFHTFVAKTTFFGDTYADGTRPVGVGFAGLSPQIGGTQVKSDATQTLPALMMHFVPTGCGFKACTSNVLFLPGFGGSRLYYAVTPVLERQVWEPDLRTDIPLLTMNADGTSKHALYTKDIIDSLESRHALFSAIVSKVGKQNLEVYGEFATHMNSLVASTTFGPKQWRAYPYDWRYDVRDIVNNGTATKMPDGSIKQVYLRDVIVDMASSSPTGRVTIVAHSNGGLLAKAAAMAFGADAPRYIDRIVMVGTPQLGTPSDLGAMLHGDGQTRGLGIISSASESRAVGQATPGLYGFVPSWNYFSKVADPVVTFEEHGALSSKYAAKYGAEIDSPAALKNFLEDAANVNAQVGASDDLHVPLKLSSALLNKAAATHAVLDTWVPPWGLVVTTIAGWGQDTVKAIAYTTGSKVVCNTMVTDDIYYSTACANAPQLKYEPVVTKDGDETVVTASASGGGEQDLYFNMQQYEQNTGKEISHLQLFSTKPIQDVIANLLRGSNWLGTPYITTSKPIDSENALKLRISSHSPVNLHVTDANGKQSGVVKMPGTDFSAVKRDIPGSSVLVLGDEQYIQVPQTGTYDVVADGHAEGPTTLKVESMHGVEAEEVATYASIPTNDGSTAKFSVTNGTPTGPAIDLTGDGVTDFTVVSSTVGADPLTYVAYLKLAIGAMPLSKRQSNEILGRLATIERQITKYPAKTETTFTLVERLEDNIKKEVVRSLRARGRSTQLDMPPGQAEIILGMINELKELI